MKSSEMILLDELPTPRQEGLIELIRYFRTALNAHKIYPIGHKMITQSVNRLLQQAHKLSGNSSDFVFSLFDDNLEFNGEKIKRRSEEANYAKQIAGTFKDQGLETLVIRRHSTPQDMSSLFGLLVSHDFVEEGALNFEVLEGKYPSISLNSTVVRRSVGDKVRDSEHVVSSAELPTPPPKEEKTSFDPDDILEHLSPYVRTGQFFFDLLSEFPSSDHWPSVGGSTQSSDEHGGPTPLLASGEFSSFSLAGLTDSQEMNVRGSDSQDVLSGISSGAYAQFTDDIGGELMLDLEEDIFTPAPAVSIPGLPSASDLSRLSPDMQEKMLEKMMFQLEDVVPVMLNKYVQQLSGHDPKEAKLRQSILERMAPEKIEASQQELMEQIEHSSAREDYAGAITLFEDMLDKQLEKGILEGVTKALSSMEQRAGESGSQGLQAGTVRILEHLQQDEKLETLLEQGAEVGRKDARELLSQLAPGSLPQCILALSRSETNEGRQKYAELLIELSRHASPEKREAGFTALIEQLDQLEDDEGRDFLFELIRNYSPLQFETHIIQHLADASDSDERGLLLRQAIAHDSPKLRALLAKLLDSRSFSDQPEEEELLLLYLHRCNAIKVIPFLNDQVNAKQIEESLRHSAVWLMGAVGDEDALAALRDVLSKKNEHEEYVYPESLRFQASHTLSRFPKAEREEVLQNASADPSMLVQGQIALILDRPLTLSTLRGQKEQLDYVSILEHEQQSYSDETIKASVGDDPLAVIEQLSSPFWSRNKIVVAMVLGVVLLLGLGWMMGRAFG